MLTACAISRSERERLFEIVRELHLPGGDATAMAWSPDGLLLAVGGAAGDVMIVDPKAAADRELTGEPAHDTVMHVCWTADGSRLAVAWRS